MSSKKDFLTLGPTPADEPCEQLGPGYDPEKARFECFTFARQLKRTFPHGEFGVKTFQHDFGSYMEVVAYFYSGETEELEYERLVNEACYLAESKTPEHWDEIAKEDLRKWNSSR